MGHCTKLSQNDLAKVRVSENGCKNNNRMGAKIITIKARKSSSIKNSIIERKESKKNRGKDLANVTRNYEIVQAKVAFKVVSRPITKHFFHLNDPKTQTSNMLRLDGGLGRTFHDENAGQGLRTKTGGMPARGDRPDLAKQPTAKQAQRLGGKGLQKADPNIISNRAQLGLSARDGAPSKQQRKKGLRDITNNTKQPTAQTLQKPSKTKAESSEVKTEEVEQIFGSSYLSPYQDPGVDVKLLRRACTSLGIKSLRDLDDVEFKLELPFEHIRDEEGLELDAAALAAEDAAVRELGLMTDLTAGLADLEQLADMDGLLDD